MAEDVAWKTVRQAARGDPDALRELVETTLDDVWALAMRMTRRADVADEITQETYARALPNLGKLTIAGRFEGYLARIATNVVLERWRRQRPTVAVTEATLPPSHEEPWHRVAEDEDERRRLDALWQAAARLEPNPRAALMLFYAQGASIQDIARILDAPDGTVKTWLHRARNDVRRMAEALLDGPANPQPQPGGLT